MAHNQEKKKTKELIPLHIIHILELADKKLQINYDKYNQFLLLHLFFSWIWEKDGENK